MVSDAKVIVCNLDKEPIELTKKEAQIFLAVAEYKTCKAAAKQINSQERSVEHGVILLRRKFRCESKKELITLAYRLGLSHREELVH